MPDFSTYKVVEASFYCTCNLGHLMCQCECGHMSGYHTGINFGCTKCDCKQDVTRENHREIIEQLVAESYGWADPDRDKDDW